MSKSHRADIVGRETVWKRPPLFRIDEISVDHHLDDGTKRKRPYISFERGNAVAALIVNTDTGQVMLVDQYRASTVNEGGRNGRLIEIAAGMILQNETPEQCLQREMKEETGYVLQAGPTGLVNVELIARFFPSAGACSELIHLYYVEVNENTERVAAQGRDDEGEFIEPVVMSLDEFFARHAKGDFLDSKLVLAGYWLKDRIRNREVGHKRPTNPGDGQDFAVAAAGGKTIGYKCGDIGKTTGVDIWVNSENTEFLMDRIFANTVSARIRTLGAKTESHKIVDDTIQRALMQRLGIGKGVELGNVIVTRSGSLRKTHGVQRIIHVASVDAKVTTLGLGKPDTNPEALRSCAISAFDECDRLNSGWTLGKAYTSILFPLIGTGDGGQNPEDVAQMLITHAIKYFEDNRKTKLEKVYILAYSQSEIEICDRLLSGKASLSRIRT